MMRGTFFERGGVRDVRYIMRNLHLVMRDYGRSYDVYVGDKRIIAFWVPSKRIRKWMEQRYGVKHER